MKSLALVKISRADHNKIRTRVVKKMATRKQIPISNSWRMMLKQTRIPSQTFRKRMKR